MTGSAIALCEIRDATFATSESGATIVMLVSIINVAAMQRHVVTTTTAAGAIRHEPRIADMTIATEGTLAPTDDATNIGSSDMIRDGTSSVQDATRIGISC